MNRNAVTFVLTIKLTQASQSCSFFYYFSARKDTNKTEDPPSPISEQNQKTRKCVVICQFAKSRNNTDFFLNIDTAAGTICGKELGQEGKLLDWPYDW